MTHTEPSTHASRLLSFLQTNYYFCWLQPYCSSYYQGNFSSPFNLGLLYSVQCSSYFGSMTNSEFCLKLQIAE